MTSVMSNSLNELFYLSEGWRTADAVERVLLKWNALVAVLVEQRRITKAAQHRSCRTRRGRKSGPDQFEADL